MIMDEQALVLALKAKKNLAFQIAMQRYGGAMLAAAKQISPRHAEDAVQEAWLAICDAIHRFEGRSSLKTWLIRITMHSTYNLLRKEKPTVSIEPSLADSGATPQMFDEHGHWKAPVAMWGDDSPDKLLEAHAMKSCMDKLLATLPVPQRVALMMTDFQPHTPVLVCETLEISINHYRVLLHRARSQLYSMLSHYELTGDC